MPAKPQTGPPAKITVREDFEGEMARRIEALKEHYGVKAAVELIRMLITLEYERTFGKPKKP